MHRLVELVFQADIRDTLLTEEPLTTLYEMFRNVLQDIEEARNKAANNPILIPDSSESG